MRVISIIHHAHDEIPVVITVQELSEYGVNEKYAEDYFNSYVETMEKCLPKYRTGNWYYNINTVT